MERVGFIVEDTFIYWSSVMLALAAVAAVCMFLGLRLASRDNMVGTFLAVPLGVLLSMVLGRLVHWYCNPDSYDSFFAALTDYSSGNYALVGVFAGCALTACVPWALRMVKDMPGMLDCMAIAGALGIAVGRLNHLFNSFDRGMVVHTIRSLPLVYPVDNAVSGEPEYRLATFMLQAMVAGVLFVALTVFYLTKGKNKGGDTCLLFLLGYGASQILLDSTRYDSLFLRSNGFVSMVQIVGAVFVVLSIVLFSVRLVRNRGWKWWYILLWVAVVGLLTCAGIMEYLVQRRGNEAAQFYNIMSACLVAVIAIGVVIRNLCVKVKRGKYEK